MNDLKRLYEEDFPAWTAANAALLAAGRFAELDIEHLTEELGDMGKSQRHELVNRLRVLLAHLLKWQFQYRRLTARWAEFEGKIWRNSIIEQRAALRYLLDEHPGLKSILADSIAKAYPQAIDLAAEETGLMARTFPTVCPYRPAEVLARDFLPIQE